MALGPPGSEVFRRAADPPLPGEGSVMRVSRVGRLGVVAVSLLALLVGVGVTPAAASDWSRFSSKWSEKCIDLRDQEADNWNAHVQQWKCKDVTNQKWAAPLQTDGTIQLVNQRNGKCMSVADDATYAGALIITRSCFAADPSQRWRFVRDPYPNASGSYWLVNANSGKCVELPGWNTGDGLLLAQSDCVGGWKQYWNITIFTG
jgi:Ricin-type beta-trefoil lectin domain